MCEVWRIVPLDFYGKTDHENVSSRPYFGAHFEITAVQRDSDPPLPAQTPRQSHREPSSQCVARSEVLLGFWLACPISVRWIVPEYPLYLGTLTISVQNDGLQTWQNSEFFDTCQYSRGEGGCSENILIFLWDILRTFSEYQHAITGFDFRSQLAEQKCSP